jgi:hypothetical protein
MPKLARGRYHKWEDAGKGVSRCARCPIERRFVKRPSNRGKEGEVLVPVFYKGKRIIAERSCPDCSR